MLIVCDNCGAEYEIDVDEDGGLGRGMRFRCSACGHTFSIGEATASTTGEVSSLPPEDEVSGEEPPPMLLKQEGKVYQVDDVATLQRWIVERRVLREDLLSIGGLKWEPVGSRRELQVFFHLVEHAERAALAGRPGESGPPIGDDTGQAMEGRAPWETTGASEPSSLQSATSMLPFGADDDTEEFEFEGVDAGLPVGEIVPDAWQREGGVAESHEDADSFFTEAGDAGLPLATVPNLADRTTEEVPAELAAHATMASGAADPVSMDTGVTSDMLFPGEVPRPAPTPKPNDGVTVFVSGDRPPQPEESGSQTLVLIAAAVVIVLLVGWWWTTQQGEPAGEPVVASEPAPAEPAPPVPEPEGTIEEPPPAEPPAEEVDATADTPVEDAPVEAPPAEAPAAPPTPTPVAAATPSPASSGTSRPAESSGSSARNSGSSSARVSSPPRISPSRSAASLIDDGWAAVESGDYSGARQAFDDALQRSPGNADARFGLGYAYEKLGNDAAAVRYYCRVATAGGGDARIEAEGRLRALNHSCE